MNWLIGLFGAAKGYLVAFLVGGVAAVIAGLAVYAKSQKGRAAKFEAKYDAARERAANARAGRDVYKRASKAAADARAEVAKETPIDNGIPDDFEGGW